MSSPVDSNGCFGSKLNIMPVEKITADAKIVEDLGADSLDVVELLSRLEDEYGVTIPDEEVENLITVSDVATELEKLVK